MNDVTTTETQWPPAPANVFRLVTIGLFRLEIDGDRLSVSQPGAVKIQRGIGAAVSGVFILALALLALPIALGIVSVSTPSLPIPPPPWMVALTAAHFARMFLGPIIIAQVIFGMITLLNPTAPFTVRRDPRTIQIGRRAEFDLPESAVFLVTLQNEKRQRHRTTKIYVLRLHLPVPQALRAPVFGLATFVTRADAERVKMEIEEFLGFTREKG